MRNRIVDVGDENNETTNWKLEHVWCNFVDEVIRKILKDTK